MTQTSRTKPETGHTINKKKEKTMAKQHKLTPDTRITSTSDFTIGDIIDAVAANITSGDAGKSIEKVVKSVVRPCALGKVPTVQTPDGAWDASIGDGRATDGNTKRFRDGKRIQDACHGAQPPVPAIDGRLATGDDQVSRRDTAALCGERGPKIATTSKWYNVVLQNGEVWTPYTSRRFLPAQYLQLMVDFGGNVDAAIARRYSLRDCFRLLDTEIEKLIFMMSHWPTAYAERSQFLPVNTICEIFSQYLAGLKANINDRAKCTYNSRTGAYWRKIQGAGRIDLWEEKTTSGSGPNGAEFTNRSINPTDWLVRLNKRIEDAERRTARCTSYETALDILRNHMPDVSMGTFKDHDGYVRFWLPKAWKESFKRQGAYYTLKSLILNCHVRFTTEDGTWRNKHTQAAGTAREGLNKLRELLANNAPAYVIHAILKKSIETSKFDIAKFLRCLRRR